MKQAKIKSTSTQLSLKQRPWLFGFLIVTVLATIWTAIENEEPSSEEVLLANQNTAMVTQATIKSRPTLPMAKLIQLSDAHTASNQINDEGHATQLVSRKYVPVSQNIFNIQTWSAPLRKVKDQVRPAPPPPTAPPIPYTYMGQIEEEGKVEFLLMQQNKLINIKVGQTLNGQWRLDGETVKYLNWTFVPLGLPQTLPKHKNQTNVAVSREVFATPEQ